MRRYYLQSGLWMSVLTVLILGGLHVAADLNATDNPSNVLNIEGGFWSDTGPGFALDKMSARSTKIALGSNATVTIDLIAAGGAGNQRDDGVTVGTVSGQGTKIAVEVFAQGVTPPLVGVKIEFDFDASVLKLDKVENSAFLLAIPEPTGVNFAATAPVTLPSSGFIGRAEFSTVADVTGREFTLGIKAVTLAESAASSNVITTTKTIAFNATASPDFDGDGMVGFSDFLQFAGQLGARQGDGTYQARYDLDGNGVIDFSDFLIFANSFGTRVPSSGGGGSATVTIADANLRAVIADSLGKSRNAPITRDEMAILTHIDARNKGIRNLTGLEHATNLQSLNLGSVWVNGELVNSNDISNLSPLSNLTNLTVLDLGNSSSISDISALSNLTNLTVLALWGNSISDISVLSNLTNLTRLYLWDNSISDISALSNLTNLTVLNLGGNSISDISALSDLTNLTRLYLWRNSISDISVLSNLTNLTRLNLQENSISDISALSNLTNLTWLPLWGNSISDISALSRLTNLKELSLSRNSISDISALSNLTNLEILYLWDNSISDISALSNLTNLTVLNLSRNSISDISALSNLTNLTWLSLWDNSISDISPLVANMGLGSGDTVDLKSNPLSSASINTHIPALQRRGVTVEFDSGSGGSSSSPDLIVESPSVSDNTLATGQSFTLSATVRNQGTGTSASTTLHYYQSSNSTISTSDTEIGTDSVSGLSASGTSAESISLNAPSSAGTYYYGACVESVTGESDTNNNCSDGVSVTVSSSSSGGGGGGDSQATPPAPQNIRVARVGSNVRVTWNSSPRATYYDVWRCNDSVFPCTLRSSWRKVGSRITGTSWLDTSVPTSAPGITVRLQYIVQACNRAGCSGQL